MSGLSVQSRSGMMFPAVLTALMVFGIVGMSLFFTGTSEYQQTAVVTYGLVANQLAMGVIDEVRAVVYDRVNNIDPDVAIWRPEVIQAARAGGTLEKPLVDELIDSKAAVEEMKGELVDAKVTFVGFRPIKYATLDTYDRDNVYYHDSKLDSEPVIAPGSPNKPRDFTGYYKIEVAVRFGRALRYYNLAHDLKIVDTSPPAREFPLFAFNVFRPDQEDYLKKSMNEGGPMNVYANDVGRIFIRGPYFLNVGDHKDGIGGSSPPGEAKQSILNNGDWWDWSLYPVFHEGLEGGTWNRRDPGRPQSKNKSFKLSLNFLGFESSGDPGMSMSNGQSWFIGNVDYPQNTNFSIFGDGNAGRWHAFRGRKGREVDGKITGEDAYTQGVGPLLSGGGSEGEVVLPEGNGLVASYNVARFSTWTFKIVFVKFRGYKVKVDRGKTISTLYGIRYEKKRKGANGLVGTILDVVGGVALGSGIGGLAEGAGFGEIFATVGQSVLEGTAAGAAAGFLFPVDGLPPTGVAADDLLRISEKGYWPPNFKPYTRAATRNYDTVLDALGGEDRPLLLDGTIMVDALDYDQPLRYRGKGILSCFTDGIQSIEAKLPGGVMRDMNDPVGANSYLTVAFMTPADPTSDEAMLQLGMPEPGRANEATFMVAGGIKPLQPKTTVQGGLVCLAINKDKIGTGESLEILYDREKLANAALGGTYDREQFVMTSVSPKIAGFSDRFEITSGGGITGEGDAGLDGFAGF